jgi:PAS domain S-box-containing protein
VEAPAGEVVYGEGSTSTTRDIYETVLEAQSETGEGFVVVEDEKITYANEAYCRMTGYEVHELKNLPSAFVLIAPEEKAALRKRSRRRLSGHREVEHYDTVIVRKDGTSGSTVPSSTGAAKSSSARAWGATSPTENGRKSNSSTKPSTISSPASRTVSGSG